jgi:imidazoleglycerol phosphate dehydratase HisB
MVINEPLAIVAALSKHIIDKKGFKRFGTMIVTIFSNDLGVGFSGNPLKVL